MGFSRRQVKRKVCPGLSADSGMNFPPGLPLGKRVPLYGSIPGCSFRLRRLPETASQSEPEFWDGFSAWGDVDAGHGRLQSDRHRICIGLRLCAENPRICFANTHRLRPPAGVLACSLQTLRVCLTLAPCIEFDSPQYLQVIKRQVETLLYLPVTYGGGAENRTPVHESPLIGISKLSRWFSLGRFARSDTLAASQPVRS